MCVDGDLVVDLNILLDNYFSWERGEGPSYETNFLEGQVPMVVVNASSDE